MRVWYREYLSWGRPLRAVSPAIANKGFFLLSFRAAGWESPDTPFGRPLCKLMDCPVEKSCVSCISLPGPQAVFFPWLKSWQCNLHTFVCVQLSHQNPWPALSASALWKKLTINCKFTVLLQKAFRPPLGSRGDVHSVVTSCHSTCKNLPNFIFSKG